MPVLPKPEAWFLIHHDMVSTVIFPIFLFCFSCSKNSWLLYFACLQFQRLWMLSPFKRILAKAKRNRGWVADKSQPAALQYFINPLAWNPGVSAVLHILAKWCAVTKPLSFMKIAEWKGTFYLSKRNMWLYKSSWPLSCLNFSQFSGQT